MIDLLVTRLREVAALVSELEHVVIKVAGFLLLLIWIVRIIMGKLGA